MMYTMGRYDVDIDLLLTLVKERPVLWDRALDIYKDKRPTMKAWNEICLAQFPNFNSLAKQVQTKWANVRDSYTKWQKKYKDHIDAGASPHSMKKYIYHKKLVFLDSMGENRHKKQKKSPSQSQAEPSHDKAGGSESSSHWAERIEVKVENWSEGSSQSGERIEVKVENGSESPSQSGERIEVKVENEDDGLSNSQSCLLTAAELAIRYERNANTHLSFFQGIIPSIADFDTEETLQFQMELLHAIKNIKNLRSQNPNFTFHY